MDKNKKKQIRKFISWCCAAALVVLLAVMPLLASGEEEQDGPQASILSGTAEYRDIDMQLVGGGMLTAEEAKKATIPAAVKLTEYLVGNGDIVKEDDPLASVDRVSVMAAITEVQETLEYLADEIQTASRDEASSKVVAQAGGIVKILYAEEGESVQDVMLEHGALAVLSLDGKMAVQIQRNTDLAAGDTVCVSLSDDTEAEGRVESNLDGILVVTVTDDGYAVGERVTVTTEDGNRIGSGELYIHSRWNATAYSGTVSDIRYGEGKEVYAGATLMTLEDTGYTAEYLQLSDKHREYEELMLELFQMYQTETLTAPCDGIVSGVDEDGTYMLSSAEEGWVLTLLANAPNGDDETEYINYVGRVAEVGIDGLVLKLNPQSVSITDYTDLSGVPMDTALMTVDQIFAVSVPVYELSGGTWMQVDAASLAQGDILLFAGDASSGGMVWIIRAATGVAVPEEPTEPSAPEEPTDPLDPSEPSDPDTPTQSTEPNSSGTQTMPGTGGMPSGGMSGISGSIAGGYSGEIPQEEEDSNLYSTETVTVASVTPQKEMTVAISIDELDISKLYIGQTAKITVDALSGETFSAAITKIGNSGESEGGNSKFTVELTLEQSENMLPGMNASAYITLDTVQSVLTVPVAALVDDGTRTVLYTGYDEETETLTDPIQVTTGVSDGEYVQILSRMEEDMAFFYAYYDTLEISNVPEMSGFSFGR